MTATDTADIGLVSPDLADGGAMPLPHAAAVAGGDDEAPALTWAAHPDARSYAVTCYDPDAPTGSGVWHWILADLPATTTTLQRATTDVGRTFVNDLGVKGYAGAAPPPGERHLATGAKPSSRPCSGRFTLGASTRSLQSDVTRRRSSRRSPERAAAPPMCRPLPTHCRPRWPGRLGRLGRPGPARRSSRSRRRRNP